MRSFKRQRGFWNFILPAAATVAGALISRSGQSSANEANAAAADRQMEFQREMSNTSWQRGVADMRAAGLNPMLAYSQGGASSPAGAMPVMHNPNAAFGAIGGEMATATSNYAQAERTRQETLSNEHLARKLEEEIAVLVTRQQKLRYETQVSKARERLLSAQTREALVSAEAAESFLMGKSAAELEVILAEAKAARVEGEIDESRYGAFLRYVQRAVRAGGSALGGAVGGFLGGRAARGFGRGRSGLGLRR